MSTSTDLLEAKASRPLADGDEDFAWPLGRESWTFATGLGLRPLGLMTRAAALGLCAGAIVLGVAAPARAEPPEQETLDYAHLPPVEIQRLCVEGAVVLGSAVIAGRFRLRIADIFDVNRNPNFIDAPKEKIYGIMDEAHTMCFANIMTIIGPFRYGYTAEVLNSDGTTPRLYIRGHVLTGGQSIHDDFIPE